MKTGWTLRSSPEAGFWILPQSFAIVSLHVLFCGRWMGWPAGQNVWERKESRLKSFIDICFILDYILDRIPQAIMLCIWSFCFFNMYLKHPTVYKLSKDLTSASTLARLDSHVNTNIVTRNHMLYSTTTTGRFVRFVYICNNA